MNRAKKIYCRVFQTGFKLVLPILPYRKPKRLRDVTDISGVLLRKNIRSVLLVTDAGVLGLGLTKRLERNLAENNIKFRSLKGRSNLVFNDFSLGVVTVSAVTIF